MQLWFELNFCLLAQPAAPFVLLSAATPYEHFKSYFASVSDGPAEHVDRTLEDFVSKRDLLVPGISHQVSKS